MVSVSTLILLGSGLVATNAKLNGWSDDFAFGQYLTYDGRGAWDFKWKVCDGWGDWCDQSNCHDLDTHTVDPGDWRVFNNNNWKYVNLRKGGSAWVDIWRANGDTFDMWEQSAARPQQGQCQLHHGDAVHCDSEHKFWPKLHCWQW